MMHSLQLRTWHELGIRQLVSTRRCSACPLYLIPNHPEMMIRFRGLRNWFWIILSGRSKGLIALVQVAPINIFPFIHNSHMTSPKVSRSCNAETSWFARCSQTMFLSVPRSSYMAMWGQSTALKVAAVARICLLSITPTRGLCCRRGWNTVNP